MQRLGVPENLASEAMAPLAQSELERARALWLRRFGTAPSTPQERARQMRFLAGRGFDGEIVSRVVRGGEQED